jgi:hypothetical protein
MYIMDSTEVKPEAVEQGCCTNLKNTISDQDFKQKVNVNISFIMELYRVVMASFLLMFVPQKCGEELCGMYETLFVSDLNITGFSVNITTFVSFLAMYFYEIRRENKMITYLHVNSEVPCDNDAVDEALNKLDSSKKQAILRLDKNYQRTTYLAMVCFVANAVLSGVIVKDSYLDSKTATAFITNILFMALKLVDAYGIANTEDNIFYSAYLKSKLQYNDVDPDKITILPEESSINNGETSETPTETTEVVQEAIEPSV